MTSNLEIVKAWQNLASDDVEGRFAYLSEDFESIDGDGKVVFNRESWRGTFQMLLASFADWNYVTSNYREEGGAVIMTGHFEGKFTGDLDLTPMGMGVIPANGKDIVWEDVDNIVTVKDGKIVKMAPHGHSGGFGPFLKGLGVEPPAG